MLSAARATERVRGRKDLHITASHEWRKRAVGINLPNPLSLVLVEAGDSACVLEDIERLRLRGGLRREEPPQCRHRQHRHEPRATRQAAAQAELWVKPHGSSPAAPQVTELPALP